MLMQELTVRLDSLKKISEEHFEEKAKELGNVISRIRIEE